jgi:hypothetical protein
MDMKTSVTKLSVVVGAILVMAACGKSSSGSGGSPTGPSRTVTTIAIGGPTSVDEGGTAQLTATAQYSDQASEVVTNQATWTSSDPAVATVSATGLVTAVRSGSADISATFESVVGRRTLPVAAARFSVRVALVGVTALDTCDDFTQGLTNGEFAVQVRAVLADGSIFTMVETPGYPGNPSDPQGYTLARGATQSLSNARTFTLDRAGEFVRMDFRATEWDSQIVIIPPSTRWVPDNDMNNRLGSRTHAYSTGGVSNLGPNAITLGSGGCQIRLNYEVSATRR